MRMNIMDRRHFLSCSLALPAFFSGAAIAEQGAMNDIAFVREILTALHPGLYRYSSPTEIKTGLTRLEQQWVAQPDLAARYLNLSRFLATIKCGHSYANFFNQSDAVKGQLFGGKTRLPFAFKWIGEEMVVLQDQSGTASLPRGTVVRAINGVRAGDVLAKLLPYARADGNNNAKRRALLSVTGADQFETFDIFYGLLYGAPKGGEHHFRIRTGARGDRSVTLPALTLDQRQGFIKRVDNRGDQPVWQWTVRNDGIAVLTMDSWGLYNSKWNWEAWLSDKLDSLRGTKGLIVDIRENEGGNDCGDVILSRLANKEIVKPTANRMVRYAKVPAALNTVLDTWDDSFRDWGEKVERFDDRYFRLNQWEGGDTVPVKTPQIGVPVAVLTSPQNSSATFQFAFLCKRSGLATLVGETTGGNQRGINGGAFFFARLPESGIEFDVPLVGYFPNGNMPDAGITPDIAVRLSAKDIASGLDRQLETAAARLLKR